MYVHHSQYLALLLWLWGAHCIQSLLVFGSPYNSWCALWRLWCWKGVGFLQPLPILHFQNIFDGVNFLCSWQKSCWMSSDRQQQYWRCFSCVTCSRVCLQQTNSASICSPFQRCSLCFVSIKENEKAVVALKSWTLPLLFVSCCCWWGLSRSIMGDGLYVCLPEPTACCCRGSLHYDAVRPCFSWLTDRAAVIRLH